MNDIERLIVFLDKLHSEKMKVKSLYDMNHQVKIYQKSSNEKFNKAGHFDFLDKEHFPTIYIHSDIISYAPLPVIQYIISHEFAHVIQYVYYFDLVMKEYNMFGWHGKTFKTILELFGYDTETFDINHLTIPKKLLNVMREGGYLERFTIDEWRMMGGTVPPIIFN